MYRQAILGFRVLGLAFGGLVFGGVNAAAEVEWGAGVVFFDRNGNGLRDAGEEGIAGVAVSNGPEVVLTDADGRWRLPTQPERTVFFVVKPTGWQLPVDAHQLPQFFYVHAPEGSPELGFPALEPTGPLPESIDFGLRRGGSEEHFKAIIFGDTQPYTQQQVDFMVQDVVPELVGTEAIFGLTLGDLVGDDLAIFQPYLEGLSAIGIPWFNLAGNHDLNFDAPDNHYATDTYIRHFGPRHYAFSVGQAHFVVLYNVDWRGGGLAKRSNYGARFHDEQLDFMEAFLATVPKEDLVVLAMHIPLLNLENPNMPANTERLFALLADRPNTLSLAAHRHTQEQFFLTAEHGWAGDRPHHHLIHGTVSGSWWQGAPDEFGIPHGLMRDGTPRGYGLLEIEGNRYVWRFQVTRRPEATQMHLIAPLRVATGATAGTLVYANVYGGTERSKVWMRVRPEDPWQAMVHTIEPDPNYAATWTRERPLEPPMGRPLRREAVLSSHLWKAALPALPVGVYVLEVKTEDMFGAIFEHKRVFTVTAAE